MTIVAAIRGMLSAGFTIEQALTAAELMEASTPKAGGEVQANLRRTARQERNARYYEARKERLQSSDRHLIKTFSDAPTAPLPPPASPEPLLFEPVKHRRQNWPHDYQDRFWRLYPKHVDKKAAMAALVDIHRADKVAWSDIVSGVERQIANVDPQFYPAPHRWLKAERWTDEFNPPQGGFSFAASRPGFAGRMQSPPPRRKSLIDGLNEVMEMIPDDE